MLARVVLVTPRDGLPLLRWLLKRLPWIDARLAGTLSGRLGAVYSLLENNQFRDAFRLSREGLSRCEAPASFAELLWRSSFGDLRGMLWWNFCECFARSATELGDDEREQVVARIARAPEPGGVMEARCLDTFSR